MRKIKMYWAIASTAIVISLLTSCQKEEVEPEDSQQFDLEESDTLQTIKLGKKLENPYSVTNMRKAWESLQAKFKVSKEGEIKATHLYVKFKPKDEDELFILKADSTLVLYDVPLDYEMSESGEFYHDPELPTEQPTYQYASIPVSQEIPKEVEFEILEELFIPDEEIDSDEDEKSSFASKKTIYELVDESLRLTGNLNEEEIGGVATAKSRWRPAGIIRVYDHVTQSYVGVSGVKVRARRWFTTRRGFTDNNGRFSCNGRFRRKANYSIKWDRYQYSIRSGTFGQAILNGPKRKGDWNVRLGKSTSSIVDDRQQYYALIHQGAHDYYYRG